MKKSLLLFMLLLATATGWAAKPKGQVAESYTIEGDIITIAEYYPAAKGGQNDWYVHFKDANRDWKIALDLKCPDGTFAGTYTINDTILDECYASHDDEYGEEVHYIFTSLNVTVVMSDGITDPKDGCEITGTASDAEGNTFSFHMKKNDPIQPKSQVNLDVQVVEAQWPSVDDANKAYYELKETNAPINHWIFSIEQLQGETTVKDGLIDTTVSGKFSSLSEERLLAIDNGKISQTFNSTAMTITVNAQLVMTDSIQYNISFTAALPKNEDDTLTYTDLQIDHSNAEYGTILLNAYSDSTNLYVQLLDYSEIPAEYSAENVSIQIFKFDGSPEVKQIDQRAVEYAKTEQFDNDSVVFSCRFLGSDSVRYTITAYYAQPQVKDTLTIKLGKDSTQLMDNTKWGEGFLFNSQEDWAELTDKHAWIKILSDSLDGHYTQAQLDENCMISYLTQPYLLEKKLPVKNADFTVSHVFTDSALVYTLSGTCQAGEHFVYLTMTADYPGLQYDNLQEDVNVTYTKADSMSVEYDNEWSSWIAVKLLNTSRNDELSLMLYPETFDNTKIPVGEYEIGGYEGSYANAGSYDEYVEEGENPYSPCYYAKKDAAGEIQTPLWFLTSGTVTVNADGSIEVQATNSYKRTVHITYTNATGLQENAAAQKAQKFLRNGQLIIRKNGIEYNAAGMRF